MTQRSAKLLTPFTLCALLACSSGDADKAHPSAAPQAAPDVPPSPSPSPAAPVAAQPTAEEIPLAEDFADQAESEISRESYRSELSALAKEIESDE